MCRIERGRDGVEELEFGGRVGCRNVNVYACNKMVSGGVFVWSEYFLMQAILRTKHARGTLSLLGWGKHSSPAARVTRKPGGSCLGPRGAQPTGDWRAEGGT